MPAAMAQGTLGLCLFGGHQACGWQPWFTVLLAPCWLGSLKVLFCSIPGFLFCQLAAFTLELPDDLAQAGSPPMAATESHLAGEVGPRCLPALVWAPKRSSPAQLGDALGASWGGYLGAQEISGIWEWEFRSEVASN